jgi:hypothetical protein
MTVGKPNFNLNSFGVKYLSKDEVQSLLNKIDVGEGEEKYGQNSSTQPNAAITPNYSPNLGNSKLEQNPKGKGKPVLNVTNEGNTTPIQPDGKTNYVFNDPRYGIPNTRKPQTTGRGALGYIGEHQGNDTTGYEGRGSSGHTGNAPPEVKNTVQSKQGKRNVKVGVGEQAKEVFDKTGGKGEKFYAKDRKEANSKQGEKRQEKENAKTQEQRLADTKVAQLTAKLEREKQEKKKIPQKTGEGDKIETEPIIETESEESFKKRSRENERKRQEAEAKKKKKKITDKERMTNIVEGYRSTRGLGKSNDIITDMNIMKLDLMGNKKDENKKDDVFSPRSADVGKREGKKQGKNQVRTQIEATAPQILNTLSHNVLNNMKYRTDEDKKENKIKKTSEETIFKAISLKLDLMKDAKDGKGSNKPMDGSDDIPFTDSFAGDRAETNVINYLETYGGDDEPTGTTLDKLQEVEGDSTAAYLNAPNMTKKQPIKPKIASTASETIFKAISLKLDLMNKLDTSPKGMKGQKFVRGSMASAGRKPATKLPNAGGVQDKLEIMRDEAPEVTPEKQAKDKKLLETGATGKPSGSVANRYG